MKLYHMFVMFLVVVDIMFGFDCNFSCSIPIAIFEAIKLNKDVYVILHLVQLTVT